METHVAHEAVAFDPVTEKELALMDAYWRACNYLAAGRIYLKDNPLLQEPLAAEHVKHRLLGHWGASPALSFVWVHLNRLIVRDDLDVVFVAGPGHVLDGVRANHFLQRTRADLLLPLRGRLGAEVIGEFFDRRTFFQQPDIERTHFHFPQFRAGLTWSTR